jgi:plasmid maintenance system antidote protein VapI
MRLARYFGTSPDVWLRLQARYDLETAQIEYGDKIEEEVKVLDQSEYSGAVPAG